MLCIMILSIAIFLIYTKISEDVLVENYLTQATQNLQHNCNMLASDLFTSYSIPNAIAETSYYGYVKSITSGSLPQKYYSVLPYIARALRSQQFLLKKSDECVLYLDGSNCIITTNSVFPVAGDCFDSYLQLESITKDGILALLREGNLVTLLPVQEVTIGNGTARRLPLLIRAVDSEITVMSLYSEDSILEALGLYNFPPNTHLQIKDTDGTILEEYPQAIHADVVNNSYELNVELPYLHASVTVWIEKSFFFDQTADARQTSWALMGLMLLIGLILCIFLSRVAVKPVRQLVETHAPVSGYPHQTNEILALSNILTRSKNQIETLQGMLLSSLLARAFSASILSMEDERHLANQIQDVSSHYRAVILHARREDDLLELLKSISSQLSTAYHAAILNTKELGILVADKEGWMGRLEELCAANPSLICGISLSFSQFQNIYDAAKQARHALSHGPGVNVYHPESVTASLWMQYERLFQSIVSNDETLFVQLLGEIRQDSFSHNIRENFYSICFVIRNAAAELNLPFPSMERFEYDSTLLPQENMNRLSEKARLLFDAVQNQAALSQSSRQTQLLNWISKNYADCNLCAATAAAAFGLSEKSIYAMVRKSTGQTFNAYLLSVRMKQVGFLLCSTRDSVSDIARRCGYPTESTFYRLFKKYYGCSPLQYRQSDSARETKSP